MGMYFSDDGRFVTSTMDFPPHTLMTKKGIDESKMAIKIQRWWRKLKNSS